MTKIGLLSDTHGLIPEPIRHFLQGSDQIWHAGDWGDVNLFEILAQMSPKVVGVYGNIDNPHAHPHLKLYQNFTVEEVNVLMMHIGGYPDKYTSEARTLIKKYKPQLFVTGHSHILKAMYDSHYQHLHLNPGAAGKYGFHTLSTAMRFVINGNRIENLEIFELKK
jgi:putative phosphoesterase